jgi:ketosteroid isomerase-like protein
MSQENVEAIRRAFELWLSGDMDAWLETVDPEVGWDFSNEPLIDVPNKGRGRKDFLEVLSTFMGGWNDYKAEVRELIDAGDQVVVVLHETARMRGTDALIDRDFFHLWTVKGSRATFLRVFQISR